jgi:hypothetical protein
MPTSSPSCLDFICKKIIERKPKSFLDIGVGFGKMGFLAREYLDIWGGPDGCWRRENWKFVVDGIEAFEEYITDVQRSVYTNIHIGDATDLIKTLDPYEFAVCITTLEHIEKNKAKEFLNNVKSKCKYSIFTIPVNIGKQGAVYGNEYECHISSWTAKELSIFGNVHISGGIHFLLEMEKK